MTEQAFNQIVTVTFKDIEETIEKKHKEYGADSDTFYNLKFGARITGFDPSRQLVVYMLKHIINFYDIILNNRSSMYEKLISEKIHDMIIYTIYLRAIKNKGIDIKFEELKEIFKETSEKCKSLLIGKADEYSPGAEERFYNFKNIEKFIDLEDEGEEVLEPVKYATYLMTKHLTSVLGKIFSKTKYPDQVFLEEKTIDFINYLLIIKALIIEKLAQLETN